MLDIVKVSYLLMLVVHVLVIIVVLIVIYVVIFNTANKHIATMQKRKSGIWCSSRKQSVLSNTSTSSNSHRGSTVSTSSISKVAFHLERTNKHLMRKLQQMTRDTKASRTLAAVVGVYSLCYAPFIIIVILSAAVTQEGPVISTIAFISITAIRFNSAINPFIYAMKLPEFRSAIRKIIHFNTQNNH